MLVLPAGRYSTAIQGVLGAGKRVRARLGLGAVRFLRSLASSPDSRASRNRSHSSASFTAQSSVRPNVGPGGPNFPEVNLVPIGSPRNAVTTPHVPSGAFLATARLPFSSVRAFMHRYYQLGPFASF